MDEQTSSTTKSDPIIIEHAGMRMTVAHRQGLGGSDEGLTFDITTTGSENEGKRILRFDCFYKNPHYHIGASSEHSVHNMKDEGVEDPVPFDGQTSRIREDRREDRPASDCRSAHSVRAGNTR